MANPPEPPRRAFLRQAALAAGGLTQISLAAPAQAAPDAAAPAHAPTPIAYPRVFSGPHLAMLAFPLGGVAAGSLSLGGRGQLRDWEIFNRPNKGYAPNYGFPSIWVRAGNAKPVARVLEARILPPYEGASGLGSNNAPGLPRLAGARFTGEYPLAHIDFEDAALPVHVSLDAFSPFIPHDAEDSGLPAAILRYRVVNPGPSSAAVSIAFSIDNPIEAASPNGRHTEYVETPSLAGLVMSNLALSAEDPMRGELVLATLDRGGGALTHWRGWPKGGWWNSPLLFWDEFSATGQLHGDPDPRDHTGSLCLQRSLAPGASATFTFLLAWRFANRTPAWCGWQAPKGHEHDLIGNHYSTRFPSAWAAAEYLAANLPRLENQTRTFAAALRDSTLPAAVKEAASANLSTLASTTCFRTADGEFHAFEGVNDKEGCCFGNCTHVWNYETATAHLFPTLARSLRKASFGYSMDDAGAIHFRQLLPDGIERSGFAAADGQMGQILHAYLDWRLSGDIAWLRDAWPLIKKALEFAWVPNGWDGDRDGVLEGVQHNTYDVEFYGPNPQCGIYYLGALRAGEEMSRALGDSASSAEYRRLFDHGSHWIDVNLFNGQFYVQHIRGAAPGDIAPSLRSGMGSEDTLHPEYQVGEGCLVDQLVGQYLADVCGLGPLLDPAHIRKTLESILRYNHKPSMATHDCVERTFALNDESALVICDYAESERPRIPFPYFAEVMTGFEYSTASHMLYAGLIREGVACIANIRARYDGLKRNPWDEAECGHHYARAMAAWSGILALSGFRYDGPNAAVAALPPIHAAAFRSFWSTATGWGTFSYSLSAGSPAGFRLHVLAGTLSCRTCAIQAPAGKSSAHVGTREVHHQMERQRDTATFHFAEALTLSAGDELRLGVQA